MLTVNQIHINDKLSYFICFDPEKDDDLQYFTTAESHERANIFKINPGDIVIDIGAERGIWALQACAAGAEKVFAFEPDKDNFYKLCRNIYVANQFQNCIPVNIGIMDDNFMAMKYFKLGKTAGSFKIAYKEHLDETAEIPALKLDTFLKPYFLAHIDFIKIDVDGAEMEVLKGAKDTLTGFNPVVYIEIHINFIPELEEKVRDIMTSYGYEEEVIFHKEKYGRNCLYRKKGNQTEYKSTSSSTSTS